MLLHIYPDVASAKFKGSLHGSSCGRKVVAAAEAWLCCSRLPEASCLFSGSSLFYFGMCEIVLQLTCCILVGWIFVRGDGCKKGVKKFGI